MDKWTSPRVPVPVLDLPVWLLLSISVMPKAKMCCSSLITFSVSLRWASFFALSLSAFMLFIDEETVHVTWCTLIYRPTLKCLLCSDVSHLLWVTSQLWHLILVLFKSESQPPRKVPSHQSKPSMFLLTIWQILHQPQLLLTWMPQLCSRDRFEFVYWWLYFSDFLVKGS